MVKQDIHKMAGKNVPLKFNLIQYTYSFFIIQLQEKIQLRHFVLVEHILK